MDILHKQHKKFLQSSKSKNEYIFNTETYDITFLKGQYGWM